MSVISMLFHTGKMVPTTEEEQINLDVAEGAVIDFHRSFTPMCYNPDFDNLKGPFLEKLPEKLSTFNEVLGR